MMRWLRRFFYSDDPLVKVAAGLTEVDAAMWRGLLADEGVRAATKNMDSLSVAYGGSTGNSYDMWVRQSDVERAREVLAPLQDRGQLVAQDEESLEDGPEQRGV